ncbi:biosynthetic-type acetolactate synthase large subunit [Candidatus Azobacteroides pseudotrichonymphae]|uniref:Acetolactate synthase n=1 Tax=Azobacteroides pseudotrichonymphae genomovar. CFP2 TaxID=511995 RepID=B6YRP6_AZOPC|nr:biosynthetic-type acetolactate synthase large subunit [Candidatus Azobacteroides pseudotrichonymphae]BAG83868.1 acetolactate synthase large subunit [Candidatus Azobacteroides pseudotrichonymphae genomovar. CFP2]
MVNHKSIQLLPGSYALIESLLHEGVDIVFGYPGGQAIPIYDALYDYKDKLRHILVRHEQGAVHAAQGYARVSGKVGVTVVTSGPGIANTITGVADAMIDSTPIVVIAGQVPSILLGTDSFQEIDVIGITQPITKWAYQVRDVDEIPWAIARAFYIALSGRLGPVVLDITKNAQTAQISYHPVCIDHIRSYVPVPGSSKESLQSAASLINHSKKPLALVGQGVILGNAEKELLDFLQHGDIPAASTMLGLSALPSDEPLNMGMLGMHGNVAANLKTNECDVLIAIGMRFDDRVTGDLNTYAKQAQIIHFDIDPSEINKNVKVNVAVLGNIKETLPAVNKLLKKTQHTAWKKTFKSLLEQELNTVIQKELYSQVGPLRMGEVVHKVSEATEGNAVLVTDVGQNQMMGVRYFKYKQTRSVVTSGGLGTMGFGLPASIGAKCGVPNRTVCLFVGDGGFQMTIQELGTIMQSNIDVKIILLNNSYLGMVRQWQELFFSERYSETAMDNPDFIQIASAYRIPGRSVSRREELDEAIYEMLETKGTYLLEAKVLSKSMVYPMIPAGACITHILLGDEK